VKLGVDPALSLVPQDRVDERAVGLVELAQLHNHLTHLVRVGVEVLLRERRGAAREYSPFVVDHFWRTRVLQVQHIEHLQHRCRRPRLNVHAGLTFDLVLQFLHLDPQTFARDLRLVQIHPHATGPHVDHQWDQGCLELEDVCQVLTADLGLEPVPKLQRHERVLLGVGPDVGRRQAPHVRLRIDAPILCCSAQHLLVLAHVDVVAAKVVQAVGEPILVDQRSGNHGVNDSPLNVNPFSAQPACVVGGVVHDLVDVRRGHLFGEPLERHLWVKVVPVLVADREVPSLVSSRHRDAHDEPVLARPTRPECGQVRVASLKVDRNLRILCQVWVLDRDVPILFKLFAEVNSLEECNRALVLAVSCHVPQSFLKLPPSALYPHLSIQLSS
jgi:hypothetical protein